MELPGQYDGPTLEMEVLFLAIYALSTLLLCSSIVFPHLREIFKMKTVGLLLASALCGLVISKYVCSPSQGRGWY